MKKTIEFPDKLSYPRLLLLMLQVDPLYTATDIILKLIGTILSPIGVVVTADFIDKAVEVFSGGGNTEELILPIIFLTFIKFYNVIIDMLFAPITLRHERVEFERLQHPFIRRIASIDIKYLEDAELRNELGMYMNNGSLGILGSICETIWTLIFDVISSISYLAIIYQYVPQIIPLILITVVPAVYLARKKEDFAFRQHKNQNLQSRYNGQYFSYLKGRKTACERAMFGYTERIGEMYDRKVTKVFIDIMHGNVRTGIQHNIFGAIAALLCFVAIYIMTPNLMAGSLTIGVFISVINTLFTVIPKISGNVSSYIYFFLIDNRRMKQFRKLLSLTGNRENTEPMSKNPPKFESLELRNVSFTYPGTKKKILDGVSMKFETGKKYSLVGVNGSGKSTITKLILRMYDDYDGEILLNGKELRKWSRCDIKAMFSAVLQDFAKYEISFEDNIKVGSGFMATDGEVDRAIELAGLTDAVNDLSEGKKAMLGKLYDNGTELSGGQWQRIAIARSVVHKSGLKILDEPTAALDPIAECDFYRKFDEITDGQTVIFISHRLASSKNSDCIFVLDGGKIVECGAHDELMEQNGLYAKMFDSQRGWYV